MSFKVIESQEELDAIIGERIERAKSSTKKEYEEKYKDYDDLKNQVSQFETFKAESESTINDLNEKLSSFSELEKKNKQLETDSLKVKIALSNGLPYEFASRLKGDTEEALIEDAKIMVGLLPNKKVPPLKNPESKVVADDGYKKLLKNLKLEEE